ncbi:MAG: recombinase family protein [bacterium]
MDKNIKWAIYARKSTESSDRQIQSIDDQINNLKAIATRDGLKVIEIIHEAKSAKEPYRRDGFTELTKLIDQGKINGLLVWKMDRLSRNAIDSGAIQYFLQKQKLLCIKTPEKNYLPQDNAIIMSVENGMSSQYIRDLSTNVKRGMRSKAEKGWFPNIPPIGYLNSKTHEKGAETILTDQERFLTVRKMWDLMLTGNYTIPKVLKIATDEWGLRTVGRKKLGGKPISVSYMYLIFTNIFYTGNFMYNGQLYKGNHKQMITMDEYDRVQILMGKKGKPRAQKHDFPFTGFMVCGGCGACITASKKNKILTNGVINTHTYYHCTKRKKYIDCKEQPVRLDDLKEDVQKIISQNLINPKFYKLGLEVLKEMHQIETGTRQEIYETQQKNVEETQKKLDRILGFLIDGTITREQYNLQKQELEKEIHKDKIKLAEVETRAKNWTELTENIVHFAYSAGIAFKDGSIQTQREILHSLGLNHQIKSKKLFIDLHSWFSVLKNGEKELMPEIKRLERKNNYKAKGRTESFNSIRPRLCVG